jgi:hypothetical protein
MYGTSAMSEAMLLVMLVFFARLWPGGINFPLIIRNIFEAGLFQFAFSLSWGFSSSLATIHPNAFTSPLYKMYRELLDFLRQFSNTKSHTQISNLVRSK